MRRLREARPIAEEFVVERLTEAGAAADLCAVEAIARASFTDSAFSAEEEISRPWSRLWVARPAEDQRGGAAPEEPVGFLIAWHVADELHVLNIATAPLMRRRGVARALMRVALRYSAAEQIRILILEVRRSNRAAIKLYRGLGFTAMGVRPGYYSDNGEDAIEMMLALDPVTGQILPGQDEIHVDG
jgi:[ribosomal protein S18]-alanine N-acetyltransferase